MDKDKALAERAGKTNADRIRRMSDEGLAEFAIMSSHFFCSRKKPAPCEKPMSCVDRALAWLRQSAPEEGEQYV